MKKIISVNRQALARGEPPISVKVRGKTFAATRVNIIGPSVVCYDPDKKRQPRVWIETTALVSIGEGNPLDGIILPEGVAR
jgi:hypothetical protein